MSNVRAAWAGCSESIAGVRPFAIVVSWRSRPNASCCAVGREAELVTAPLLLSYIAAVANVTRKHVKERIQNFDNCVQCHRSAHDNPREGHERGREED